MAEKTAHPTHSDAVEELRYGWDQHVAFGLAHPGLFSILNDDPQPGPDSPISAAGHAVLRRRVRDVALAGRLRVSEDRAVALLRSMCNGVIVVLLGEPAARRDPGLSATAREAFVAAVTGEANASVSAGPRVAAVTLHASLDQVAGLTAGERHLLAELLERIAGTG